MKKSELKEMISEIVEEKLEDFFINDLNEIVTKIVSNKMSKMLKEANKGTLKDRIMNKIDQKEMSDYDQMNEIAFGERNGQSGQYFREAASLTKTPAKNISQPGAILKNTGKKLNEIHEEDIDNLAQADYDDAILGIE